MSTPAVTPGPLPAGRLIPRSPLALRWLLVLLLWLPVLAALAQQVPPRPTPARLVNDLAGLMQPGEADALERKLVAYNDSTSSQLAVVTVPDMGGDEIASYAQRLYQAWGIGQKEKNNGILVLVAKQERTARIQTGYGMEGAVPDAIAKRIITNTLVPAFQQNQYYAGLDRATDQLFALARGEYKVDADDVVGGRGRATRDRGGSSWTFWLVIGLLVLFFIFRNRGGGGGQRSGFGGGFVPPIIFGDFSGGRGVFGGGGGFGGGDGGGGGFGGFGGGSSGGGGASGNW